MYSVIVVDDESEIREGIINRVPWTELGFEVIGDAENGVEALDLVETLQPDVVMSDIKIPFMDGLTLAEKIRETSLSTKVIIFSGFDDFDYAKRAIRLNVVEYIMKPISASELSQTLRKLKKDLDEEREARRNLERMRSLFDTSLPVLREQFLQKLLTGSATEEQLTAQADLLQMDLTVSAKSPLYVVYFGQIESSAEPNPLEFFSLQQTVEETLTAHAKVQSFVRGGSLLVFVTLNPQEDDLTLIRDLNSVCSYAHVVLLMEVGAGVSTPITSLASVAKAYEEAFTAYTHSRENGKPQALSFTDVSPANARPFPISSEAWRDFSQAISLKTPEQLNVVIDDLFRNLRRLTWNKRQLEELSLEFLTHFLQMIRNYDIETDRIVDP